MMANRNKASDEAKTGRRRRSGGLELQPLRRLRGANRVRALVAAQIPRHEF